MRKLLLISLFFTFVNFCFAQAFSWSKGIGGTTMDRGYALATDTFGNVFTTGHFSGTVDFDPGVGTFTLTAVDGRDIFILKLDENGNFLWARGFGGNFSTSSVASDEGNSIAVDSQGNVYTTGTFSGTIDFDPGPGTFTLASLPGIGMAVDGFILKLDGNGNFIWADRIGGKGPDIMESIISDANGDIYVTGVFQDTVDFDPGPLTFTLGTYSFIETPFVMKLTSSGNLVWANAMVPQSFPDSYGQGRSVTVDQVGDIVVTGWYKGKLDFDPGSSSYTMQSNPAGSIDVFIMKLDNAGNFLWSKSVGSPNTYPDYGKAITVDSLENIYVTGFSASNSMDFDPGPGTYTIAALSGGYILKLDSNGDFVWARPLGSGGGITTGCDIMTDALGNVYCSGYFIGNIDFDTGPTSYTLESRALGGQDANTFILKLNAAGNFLWAGNMGATPNINLDYKNAMAMDGLGVIYLTGHYTDGCDFDPGPATFSMVSNGGYDMFITRLEQPVEPAEPLETGIQNTKITDSHLKIYPNPAQNNIKIFSENELGQFYTIYDQMGKLVLREKQDGQETTIDISTLANGFYVLESEPHPKHIKLIKQ